MGRKEKSLHIKKEIEPAWYFFMELTVYWKICEATSIMLQQSSSSSSSSSSSYNFQIFHITQKLVNYPEKTAVGRLQYLLLLLKTQGWKMEQ
jgi:hypothetical protein